MYKYMKESTLIEKTSQHGFGMVAVMLSMSVLIGVSYYFLESSKSIKNKVLEAKYANSKTNADQADLSALARLKGLLSPKRVSEKSYVPYFYSKNYYSKTWLFSNSGSGVDFVNFLVPKSQFEQRFITSIFDGTSSILKLRKNAYQVKVIRTNFSSKKKQLAESIDVDVTPMYKKDALYPRSTFRARIPIMPPTPIDVKLMFRKKGAFSFEVLGPDIDLSEGGYEFQVLGSGVILDASVRLNGGEISRLGGLSSNGQVTHGAVNYAALDVPLGPPFEIALTKVNKRPVSSAPHVPDSIFNETTCSLNEVKLRALISKVEQNSKSSATPSQAILEVIAYGPDGLANQTTGKIKVRVGQAIEASTKSKTSEGTKSLTDEDYQEVCSQECPYSPQVELIELKPTKSNPRIAGLLTKEIARVLKINKFKACIDSSQLPPESLSISEAPLLIFDPKTCKPYTLFKANSWPTNCS